MTLVEYLRAQALMYSQIQSVDSKGMVELLNKWAESVAALEKSAVQVEWQGGLYNAVIMSESEPEGEFSAWSPDNQKPNPWREALIDACVIDCIGWNELNPRASLRNLIKTELMMYTDTRIGQPPHGWKMVPIEPTPEMIQAVADPDDYHSHDPANVYEAMVNNAPIPEKFQITDGQVAELIKKMIAPKVIQGEPITPQDWFNFARACRALVPVAPVPNNDLTNPDPAV